MPPIGALVSCNWLSRILSLQPQFLRVLDASWNLPGSEIEEKVQFTRRHIPSAEFFDIEKCSLPLSKFSHTLPKPEHFAEYVGNLGIDNDTHVVIYENQPEVGMFAAPRVWWMFRVFGHNDVSVLNGGFSRWVKEGNIVASSSHLSEVEKKKFEAVLQPDLLKGFDDMVSNLKTEKFHVMDARSEARFYGQAREPREGIPRGHIPKSTSLPYTTLLHCEESEDHGLMKSPEELKQIFAAKGIDYSRPLTATCGSGITACILALAAHEAGKKDVAVYDGSWEEYGLTATPEQMVVCKPKDPSGG